MATNLAYWYTLADNTDLKSGRQLNGEFLVLFYASLALLAGPLAGALSIKSLRFEASNDGITIALVLALVSTLVMPHVISELGFSGALIFLCGALLARTLQKIRLQFQWPFGPLFALIGLHAIIDGALLNINLAHGSGALPWIVIAHRLPFGFAIFAWAVRSTTNRKTAVRRAALGVGFMVVLTIIGFASGQSIISTLPASGPEVIEALVAGALLMFVLMPRQLIHHDKESHSNAEEHTNGPHTHVHGHHHGAPDIHRKWAGIGALVGFSICFLAISSGSIGIANPFIINVMQMLKALVLETAPALLIGFTLAGVIPSVLTHSRVTSLRSNGRFRQAAKGVAYGIPLPICSCSVVPVYQSLIKRGAPPAAALGFFVATPELGIDAVILSVPLLGESLTIARVVAAIIVAFVVALVVRVPERASEEALNNDETDSSEVSAVGRFQAGIKFGFVEVFDHTMPWIALGLMLAAVIEPLLAEGFFHDIHPFIQVPLAAITAIPLYVCASGATPIAALAIHKGLSAGAALTFLIAGPATNITTFGVLAMLHGRRIAIYFGATILVLAVFAGWFIDLVGIQAAPLNFVHEDHAGDANWFQLICATILGLLMIASLLRQGPRGFLGHFVTPIHAH